MNASAVLNLREAIACQVRAILADPASIFQHRLLRKLGKTYADLGGVELIESVPPTADLADRLRAVEIRWAMRPTDRQRTYDLLAALQAVQVSHPHAEIRPLRGWLYKQLANDGDA